MARKMKCVLTIAGSDSGAGAGIQSDLKTFHNHCVYGLTVITAITAQNAMGVQKSFELPVNIIEAQLKSVFDDFKIDVIKIGMLSSEKVVHTVVKYLKQYSSSKKGGKGGCKIVLDPVILSKNKYALLENEGILLLKKKLLPLTYLVTPNLYEAEKLSGIKIRVYNDVITSAEIIHSFGCRNVLVKGGHFSGKMGMEQGTDILYDGKDFTQFGSEIIKTKNTHGIGCTLSSAIAANLANNKNLNDSIISSKAYILKLLSNEIKIGKGTGPVEK